LVLVGDVGDAAQLGRIGHAAPHARNHRVGAVLLNVGVSTFIDQARLRIVPGFARPGGNQVVVQRRAAGRAAVWCAPAQVLHGLCHGRQVLFADRLADLSVVEIAATADGLLALGPDVSCAADGADQDLLHQAGTGPAGAGGLGVLLDLVDRKQAVFLNRLDDGALANAVTAADFHAVRHVGGLVCALMADVADGAFAEHQVVANLADILALANLPEIPAAVGGVAVQAGADQHVILDHQLLVYAADGVGEGDG